MDIRYTMYHLLYGTFLGRVTITSIIYKIIQHIVLYYDMIIKTHFLAGNYIP